jgi:molybdopterin-guanine dinucleotide biosynthesis protein A
MGRNKARLRLAGEPLWRRQQRALKEAGASPIWIVQAPGQRALTRGVLRDTVRDAGPLAGVHAALVRCDRSHMAVLAVDLPFIDRAWWVRLAKLCSPGIGVVARTRAGYEPLAAIYPREVCAEAATRLEKGEFALQKFVTALVRSRRMRVLRLNSAETRLLANWNTPEDVS